MNDQRIASYLFLEYCEHYCGELRGWYKEALDWYERLIDDPEQEVIETNDQLTEYCRSEGQHEEIR